MARGSSINIVEVPLPQPNAYDAIVELGNAVEESKFGDAEADWESHPHSELLLVVTDIRNELDLLHSALRRPSRVPVDYVTSLNPTCLPGE